MQVVSLFSGAGGLDRGFEAAGFDVVFANDNDPSVWPTYERNFLLPLDRRSIIDIPDKDFPDADVVIGGPPCQSWSEAGANRGLADERGQLFYEYIRALRAIRPKFFLAENVSGLLAPKHEKAFSQIVTAFAQPGYRIYTRLVNASDYGVPQDRERVILVGVRRDLRMEFEFPSPSVHRRTLRDAIFGLPAPKAVTSYSQVASDLQLPNHEYIVDGYSPLYLSRNRVRTWDEPSFTIQASGRHAPLHPRAPRMEKLGTNRFRFVPGKERMYRRLSVRECARIQAFPDSFHLDYRRIADGYKLVGNAVPVELSRCLAQKLAQCMEKRSRRGLSTRVQKA